MTLALALLLLLLLPLLSVSQPPAYGEWDRRKVIQYVAGTVPIVLSVPHAGRRRPSDIVDRNSRGCYVAANRSCDWSRRCPGTRRCKAMLYGDENTDDIAWHAWRALSSQGLRPHIVVNHMDRAKMDPNRGGASLSEGVQNDPGAKETYLAYHDFLSRATLAAAAAGNGTGVVFDIHGQHHPQNWTEIGYRLTKEQLNKGEYPRDQTSIRGLMRRLGLTSAAYMIVGPKSFGSLLAGFGHRVVPSQSIPAAGSGGGYYRGGYITAHYGSLAGGFFDALQVEITQAEMYASPDDRKRFGQHLAAAIGVFVRSYYYFH